MSGLAQVFLMSSDLDAARDFYEDSIGLAVSDRGETSVAYETGACELKLQADFDPDVLARFDLSPPPETGRGAGAVFVVRVEDDDLEAVHDRMERILADSPGDVLTEPTSVPWGGRMFLARDPDGYVLEIRPASG